ncbi:cysteine desulfurase family protein [Candidatus Phycosocius spiralis]|uniref:Cysteine desulfurase n=1 Tax=Candidatus Phycosocius spiralis TaxID=2815099 RepID=A0ABQ4PSX1_9PROT|nr:aminotransferase class V-fold PLP-dependent enzyme [Candidatus Phycosocius spiralis]GIU66088.1 cysteine desulfurase [Candidatus Phycosocius spiralis]
MNRLYADHNATSPLRAEAREAMVRALDLIGNPSSVHGEGRAAKRALEDARENLAATLQCHGEAIYFTSGATEALHIALESAHAMDFKRVFISPVEHDAVWAYAQKLWPDAHLIAVNQDGLLDMDWLSARLGSDASPALVIAQGANHEIGTLQNLNTLSSCVRASGGALMCDGVQMAGKTSVSQFAGFADWLIISSHKLGGPAGVGALIVAPGINAQPIRSGGGQERGARSGTENLAAIIGFAAAARAACDDEAIRAFSRLTGRERDSFERIVTGGGIGAKVIGTGVARLTNTSCLMVDGWEGSSQVMALDLAGAAVSAGSACTSGKVKASRILQACGYGPAASACAIRVSFGWSSEVGDGVKLANLYLEASARLGRTRSAHAA